MEGYSYDLEISQGDWSNLYNRQAVIHRWCRNEGMTVGATLIIVDENPNFLSTPFGGYESSSTYFLHFKDEADAVTFATAWLL